MAPADLAVRQMLGGPVTYTPGSGAPAVVQGVFDSAYVKVDAGQAGVMSTSPAVFLTLADLPSNPSDDTVATVTVGGTVYEIWEARPDGMGTVLLLLHLAT